MKKKKIIFVLTVLGPGGAEKVVSIIANSLPRNKYDPNVILFDKNNGHIDMLDSDVGVLETKTERIRNSIFPILNFFRKEKPDIVFASYGELNAYISIFIKLFPKIKFIARETNVVSMHVTRPEIKFFYRFYNNYHQIVCQSDDMYQDLKNNFGIKEDKLIKINNPVDFDAINVKLYEQRKPIEFEESYKNVIAVGNLSYRKGFDLLLNVFQFLKKENIRLYILGDGRDKEMLNQMKIKFSLDNVFFLGQKKNPYPYMKYADLFVLSSRYEGFPNVLLEAGACGTYSLVNNCPGGINEIVQEGINAEIFPIEDSKGFAEKIKEVLQENHSEEQIIESIHSRFNKEKIIQEYESIFEKLDQK